MKKYLVVVDMQRDFVDGALGTGEAVAIVEPVAEKIRSFPGKIFVTYDTHGEDYLDTAEGKKLPVKHCIKGTPGWQLAPQVEAALQGKPVTAVEKHTFGASSLPEIIVADAKGEDFSLELVGLCTDICVVSNALLLKAHFPEQEITVDGGLCAGVTPETHEAALKTMGCCQINIV